MTRPIIRPAAQTLERRRAERRIIRPAPPSLHRQVRRNDLILNALNRDLVTPSMVERVCWLLLAALAVVSFYLIASL